MVDLRELENTREGQTALILGGGPSLPEQYQRAPDGFKFSVNQHGCILTTCDAALALDRKPVFHIKQYDVPVYHSRSELADVRLTQFWNAGNSSMTAVWIADFMGFSRIILLGMDCYGGGTYFWDEERKVSGSSASENMHRDKWITVKRNVPGWWKIRTMGGPTSEIFPLFDPDEVIEEPAEVLLPTHAPNMRHIHCLADTRAGNQSVEMGGLYWVRMDHAHTLVQMGKAEYVND